jgi:hypothetical protein
MFMKDKRQIEQEVEKTLGSLDHVKRAGANPFLFTRIEAALKNEERRGWGRAVSFMARPVVAFATILLILLVNFAVFFSSKQQTADEEQQLYASEYFSNTTISDYDNAINE